MKFLKNTFLVLITVSMMGALAVNTQAQSNEKRRTAVQAFNKARDLAKNNEHDASIAKFKEAIKAAQAAESAGQKGADIVKMSKEKLPAIYYDKALNAYRTFQSSQTMSNLENTITAFKEAADAGEQYGSQKIVSQSTSNITKLTYAKSRLQYSQKNYDAALATIEQVIEANPNYATAYYHKGLILKKKDGNFDEALAAFDKAIAKAEETGNSQIARKAKENASSELVYRGANQTADKNYTTAIDYLNRALEYNPESANAHYRLAEAFNDRGDYSKGLSHGQKALELENGGRATKAKIYYEVASAYKGQGNFDQACDAYANAAYGSFRDPANHQMEYELKCDSK